MNMNPGNGVSSSVTAAATAAVEEAVSQAAAVAAGNVRLTKREVEVLTLVIEGKSSKEVADHLYVSKRTVDFHLANIYQKLNVTNRVQAFRVATRRNLIPFNIAGAR